MLWRWVHGPALRSLSGVVPGAPHGPDSGAYAWGGVLKGGVYLYLHGFPLQGAVAVVAVVGPDQYRVAEQVVLNGHQVPQAGRDHLVVGGGCEGESM